MILNVEHKHSSSKAQHLQHSTHTQNHKHKSTHTHTQKRNVYNCQTTQYDSPQNSGLMACSFFREQHHFFNPACCLQRTTVNWQPRDGKSNSGWKTWSTITILNFATQNVMITIHAFLDGGTIRPPIGKSKNKTANQRFKDLDLEIVHRNVSVI